MWGGGGSRRGPMVKSKKTTVFKVPEGGGATISRRDPTFSREGWDGGGPIAYSL